MRSSPPFFWPFTCSIILLLSLCALVVSGKCLGSQQSLLLQLRNSLDFSSDYSTKLVHWNESFDCCSWEGVTCEEGRVTHLNLSHEGIHGGLDNSSTLFDLQHLKSLDLSDNEFNSTIPSRIGSLTNLSSLNLRRAGFWGEIPIDVSRLRNLVSLDLSFNYKIPTFTNLEIRNLTMLLQNLSKLQELYLDETNISAPGNRWCEALSSTVPNLQILSLSFCNVPGPLDQSLLELQSLTEIHLHGINFSSPVPQFFAEFSSLTLLNLGDCGLQGTFPSGIFQVPTLQVIDLSSNELLEGTLPEFHINNSLQELDLSYTKFSGRLPASLGNLWNLYSLDLSNCQFTGILPSSMSNLTQIVDVDLSRNNFIGPIPSFNFSTRLKVLDLFSNSLFGEIPLTLFTHPSLEMIRLSNNNLSGPIPEFKMSSYSLLYDVDLSHNDLEGLVPASIFKLKNLSSLDLSYNYFTGANNLEMFQGSSTLPELCLSNNNLKSFPGLKNLSELTILDLSHNSLKSFPGLKNLSKLINLDLSYNNLESFPDLRNQSLLFDLDLSYNHILGEIPKWISEVGKGDSSFQAENSLDLSFNQLQGNIPLLLQSLDYLDLSSNNLTSLPYDNFHNFSRIGRMSLSNNSLTGVIHEGTCAAKSLKELDLSHNSLSGRIPKCLTENSDSYIILILGGNNFEGPIPDAFPKACSLKALVLHRNSIEGEIPKSLSNCIELKFLDLGHNQLIGDFPCLLKNISTVQILVLRSNKLSGSIECPNANGSWPMLQIFDVAQNNFSGELPRRWLTKLQQMMVDENGAHSKCLKTWNGNRRSAYDRPCGALSLLYVYTVQVTSKGKDMELPVILLSIFASIDLSRNNFHGQIPAELGLLKALYVLNLSYNALGGQIPSSVGSLRNLESLDLSSNNLSGRIPTEFKSLNFLAFLNLSFNQLVGMIPAGSQLQTFPENSFIGNKGLYGCPLRNNCSNKGAVGTFSSNAAKDHNSISGRKINWNLLIAEVGLFTGFGVVVLPLMFLRRWRIWYYERVDDIIFKIFPLAVSRKWFQWTTT